MQNADLKQNSLTSKIKAVNIAMPSILKYATENHRIITDITATFWWNLHSPAKWEVDIGFLGGKSINDPNYGIIGYQVTIWADIGKIEVNQPMGIM